MEGTFVSTKSPVSNGGRLGGKGMFIVQVSLVGRK